MSTLPASRNLLEEWYSEAMIISSPLAIIQQFERVKVEFIFRILNDFFELQFFEIKAGTDKPVDKTSWIWGLLTSNKFIPCYHALYDVCQLIEYSKKLDDSIQNEMIHLKKNPENLRTFFFELFIYRLLDLNGVVNAKKVISGIQVLEGTCELNSKSFLFECRKAFMPNIQELDIKRRLLTDIHTFSREFQRGIGMICTIKLVPPISGAHLSDMRAKLRMFFKKLSETNPLFSIKYIHSDEKGSLSVIDYDEATLIDIQAKKQYDILYYVVPPKTPVPNIPNHYQTHIECNFSIDESLLYKKLENLLRQKKKQHRNSPFQNKIIFLDSESLPELHMNIFQNDSMFDLERIKEIYIKVGLKDILCITRRSYDHNGPILKVDVIAPEHLQETGRTLKLMLLEYHNDLKKSAFRLNNIIIL